MRASRYGHGAWAAMGAVIGGVAGFGFQVGPLYVVVGVMIGALVGAALRG